MAQPSAFAGRYRREIWSNGLIDLSRLFGLLPEARRPAGPENAAALIGPGKPQIALAAMFTVSASSATLKKNETTLWPNTVRRIGLQLTVTSETCAHMPITNEKYIKSQ